MEVESIHHQVKWISKLQTVAIHQVGKFRALPQLRETYQKMTVWLTFWFQNTSNKRSQRKRESLWVDRSEPNNDISKGINKPAKSPGQVEELRDIAQKWKLEHFMWDKRFTQNQEVWASPPVPQLLRYTWVCWTTLGRVVYHRYDQDRELRKAHSSNVLF